MSTIFIRQPFNVDDVEMKNRRALSIIHNGAALFRTKKKLLLLDIACTKKKLYFSLFSITSSL